MKKHKKYSRLIYIILSIFILFVEISNYSILSKADDGAVIVEGNIYEFEKNCKHVLSNATNCYSTENYSDTYGTFLISGNIVDINSVDMISIIGVDSGVLKLSYTYTDVLLGEKENGWYLVSDDSKEVDGISLDGKIQSGSMVIQTSKDGAKWIDTYSEIDVFATTPIQTESFYSATEVQLKNGCYYRVLISYELCRKTGTSSFLFISYDDYEYKRVTEEYLFYAYDVNEAAAAIEAENDLKYSFSDKINTGLDNGYSGMQEIDRKDVHYGWDLGEFFVRGFSQQTVDEDGTIVFLKTTGDDVVLYFNLQQDIDALNGDDSLSISADNKGYDKYFEIPQTYMGRGTLIIRYTDYENVTHDPIIYTDFLSAEISPGADTMVQLCEEGDYEVSLDYEIKEDNKYAFIDVYSNYKIFFKFSIRNGKCMVYPIDVSTGADLSNSSYTENGFSLDLAYSRYLELSVTKENTNDQGELVTDYVYTDIAKNGSTFTDEGIYIIVARNKYTDQSLTKIIYVGTDDVLKVCAKTGMSPLEINQLIARGAVINKYGDIDVSEVSAEDFNAIVASGGLGLVNANSKPTTWLYLEVIQLFIIVGLVIAIIIISISRSRYVTENKKMKEQKNNYEKE